MEVYNKHKKLAETEEVALKFWQHLHFKAAVALLLMGIFTSLLYGLYLVDSDKKIAEKDKMDAAQGIKVGVFMPDPDKPGEEVPTNDDLKNFDTLVGRKTDIFLWYESISESFYTSNFLPMAQDGRIIQLAWEPDQFGNGVNQPDYQLRDITAGNHDANLRRWARELKGFAHEVYFRPMCEMNGNWRSWDVGNPIEGAAPVNGNLPSDYVPAWRHIHDIFVQEGATNVKFVWAPNRNASTEAAKYTFDNYYPGDNYVDYIGLNGYNWGTLYNTADWTSIWESFTEVFRYSYDTFAARTSKPFIVSETASTESGGNKGDWIRNAYGQVAIRFPRITSITWFNVNKETDWRINSSAGSLDAYKYAMTIGQSSTPTGPYIPVISVSSPTDGATVSNTFPVVASATGNEIQKVDFYVGSALKGTVAAPNDGTNYKASIDSKTLTNGTHSVVAEATDKTGQKSQGSVKVNVINDSQTTLSIISPASGTTVTKTFSVIAASNVPTGTKIQFLVDNLGKGSLTAPNDGANYKFTHNSLNLPNGTHEIKVQTYSSTGVKTEAAAKINVQNPEIPVYRYYTAYFNNYYTASESVKAWIEANWSSTYWYMGVQFKAYKTRQPNTYPVYQFYDSVNKTHYYTKSESEKSYILTHLPWTYNGIAFYNYPTYVPGTKAVYLFYNPVTKGFLYTQNLSEGTNSTLYLGQYFQYKGIAFYAYPK